MPDTHSETEISAELDRELRDMFCELTEEYNHKSVARIYDDILTRVQKLLYPIWKNHEEYWHDQKLLYNFLVRKIVCSPEVLLARERFQYDLEDFFRKKPTFRWRGLWVKELIDLSINIPLTLGDLTKLIVTKAGQFVVSKVERASYDCDAREHAIHDDSASTDGHIMSSSKRVFLPFLRFVRTSPDYDHPVFVSLYAYLILIFDTLCSIFQHTTHPRSQNLLSKLIPIRAELVAIAHTPRPPENLRQSFVRVIKVLQKRKKWNN